MFTPNTTNKIHMKCYQLSQYNQPNTQPYTTILDLYSCKNYDIYLLFQILIIILNNESLNCPKLKID